MFCLAVNKLNIFGCLQLCQAYLINTHSVLVSWMILIILMLETKKLKKKMRE